MINKTRISNAPVSAKLLPPGFFTRDSARKLTPLAATLRRLDLTMMDQPDYDEEFLPPTWEAFDDALRIIVEAGAIIGSVFPLGDACPDGAGGLRTSWRHGARQVRLVIPSTSAQSPYIYWQQDKTPNVGKNPTGETLAERLAWMIDNDDRTVTM